MEQLELDNFKSEQNKQVGINKAIDSAELKQLSWKDEALKYLRQYPDKSFMAEDVRVWAHRHGLIKPPSARAWGGIIQRAARLKIIRQTGFGFVNNPNAHRTPAAVWEKVSF